MQTNFHINSIAINFCLLIIILYLKNFYNHGPCSHAPTTVWLIFPHFRKWEFDFERVQLVQEHILKRNEEKIQTQWPPGSLFTTLPIKLYHLGRLTVHWKHFQGRIFIYTTLGTINICLNLSCSRPINTLWNLWFRRLGFLFMQC